MVCGTFTGSFSLRSKIALEKCLLGRASFKNYSLAIFERSEKEPVSKHRLYLLLM
ncbi:MAG: hypothetical protein U5L45_07200 [Saprospiraceae bacterium]|nr:hypothetical protein [Saprospiraceae bacterium]